MSGIVRKLSDIIFWGKCFLAVITVEAVILLSVEIAIINDISGEPDSPERDADIVYAILLCVSLLFFLLFAYDMVLYENSIQLVTFLLFSVLMVVYSLVQLAGDMTNPLLIVQFSVLFLFEIALFFLGYKVYSEFGWKVYKKVGADPRMRNLYRSYLILLTLIKLDFAMAVILISQNLSLALETDDPEFALNICAIFVVIAFSLCCVLGVRQESIPLTGLFFAMAPLEPAYIIFKIVRFLTVKNKGYDKLPRGQMISSGIFAILLRIVLCVVAFKCYTNFGKGLSKYIQGNSGGAGAGAGAGGTELAASKRQSTYDVNSLGSYNANRVIQMTDD